jgi:hypothetical protein
MGRRVTVGQYPITSTQLFINEGNISSPNSQGAIDFSLDGIVIGKSTGKIELITNTEIDNGSELHFYDAGNAGYAGFKAPATVDSSVAYALPVADGSRADMALLTDAAGSLSWQNVRYTYSVINNSFLAESWKGYFVDTTAGTVIATLPSSPVLGDTVRFFDVASNFDTNNLTVNRNGELIMGDSADMTITTVNAAFDLVYSNSTYGWRIITV